MLLKSSEVFASFCGLSAHFYLCNSLYMSLGAGGCEALLKLDVFNKEGKKLVLSNMPLFSGLPHIFYLVGLVNECLAVLNLFLIN